MHNEYCASTKNISCKLNGLRTNSRGGGTLECITYFNSTQSAIYNGMNYAYRITADMD